MASKSQASDCKQAAINNGPKKEKGGETGSAPKKDGSPISTVFKKDVPPGLKPIFVNQMYEQQDWVYRKRVLHLTLIEDPMFGFNATNVAGQDAKGNLIRVSIYEIPQNDDYRRLLAFGTQLGIINPYHRIAMDGKNGIRVEHPDQIVRLGRKENMCRYCGEENAQRKCAKCKVNYCSRDCQVADWKILNHKAICK